MRNVKFGLRIPAFPVDGSDGNTFVRQILTFMEKNKGSFDSAWVCDHFVPWAEFVTYTAPNLEGFTALSFLSGRFEGLLLGNIVLCNSYRNPALLAKMGATLQTLSGGHFVLGIGAGWKKDEYESYGYEFPQAKTRIQELEEGVQIIRKMWTRGKTSFSGRHYKVENAHCFPKPDPVPPIMIGGGGEKYTLKVVARHADWWNIPNVSPQTYEQKLKILDEHCKIEGRDFSEIVKTLANMVSIAETEDKAADLASKSKFIEKGREKNFIIGDPNSVVDKIREYTRLGVEHYILRFIDFPETKGAKLFSSKVIPKI